MFLHRIEKVYVHIQSTGTNWKNVEQGLFNIFENQKFNRKFQQRQNLADKLARDYEILTDGEDSFINHSNVLCSTPVSTPTGSFGVPMQPRISVIPKRTPLRQNKALMNAPHETQTVIKRSKLLLLLLLLFLKVTNSQLFILFFIIVFFYRI